MNFKEYFIITESHNERRSTPINQSTFEILYNTHCKNYNPKGMPLFRSIRSISDKYLFTDPRHSERYATETHSYIMWFIESLPEWKKFPPRSKSIITASHFGTAASYHGGDNVYRVIPFDNTNIGICSGSDFWGAFENLDVTASNHIIDKLINCFYKGKRNKPESEYYGAKINSINKKQFLNFINSVDYKLFDDLLSRQLYLNQLGDPRYGSKKLNPIFHPLEAKYGIATYNTVDEIRNAEVEWNTQRSKKFKSKNAFSILKNMKNEANPDKNEFKHMTHEQYNGPNKNDSPFFDQNREIWFSNKSLMIKEYRDEYDQSKTVDYLESI